MAGPPALAQQLFFNAKQNADPANARRALQIWAAHKDASNCVLGLSAALCSKLGIKAPKALKAFSSPPKALIKLPDTPYDLWISLCSKAQDDGAQQAALLARQRVLMQLMNESFLLKDSVSCFRHGEGRDLTGYEDGTENPKGKKAVSAGLASDGSSFAAIQKWQHQWPRIDAMTEKQRNHAIGRVRTSNKEIEDAPETAHIKRTTQEDFTLSDGSQGFSVRRSMPWRDGELSGLLFTSFGKNFEAFEAQLARMVGADDGITDAIFSMSQPLSTAYFWCPPAGHSL